MSSRVAQVLYTATSLQPNAKVWIDIEGKPLEVLGGEGLLLEQPLTRESFEKTLRSSALLFYSLALLLAIQNTKLTRLLFNSHGEAKTRLHNSKIMSSSTL